jgi:hypothetical protein
MRTETEAFARRLAKRDPGPKHRKSLRIVGFPGPAYQRTHGQERFSYMVALSSFIGELPDLEGSLFLWRIVDGKCWVLRSRRRVNVMPPVVLTVFTLRLWSWIDARHE